MEIKVSLNYLQMAPRKVRLVAECILGMSLERAKAQLSFSKRRVSKSLLKLLNSAAFDAKHNFGFNEKRVKNLYIRKILVNEGPRLKRFRPVSRGTAHQIQKKTSHITLVLDERKIKNQKPKIKNKNKKH